MNKDYKFIAVDALNLFYRHNYTIGHLTTSKGIPSGALYGSLRGILALTKKFEPKYMAICFEGKNSKDRRQSIDENYKANRSSDEPVNGFWNQLNEFEYILKLMGMPCIRVDGQEADDTLSDLAHTFTGRGMDGNMLVVSEDHDMYQCLRYDVDMYRSMKKEIITLHDFEEWYDGIPPWRYPEIQALTGCDTGNVEGIRGIGDKTAKKILLDCETIAEVAQHPKVKDHKDQFLRNFELVKHDSSTSKIDLTHLSDFKLEDKMLKVIIYNRLGMWEFNSILKTLEDQNYGWY